MTQFSAPAGIGHNSVQIPHDGRLVDSGKFVKGAKFKARSFFRPTGMIVAMAAAGIIPDIHLVRNLACTATLRHKHDTRNGRPSARVAF